MRAVGYRLRSALRVRWAATAMLAVVVALVTGIVIAVGGRRRAHDDRAGPLHPIGRRRVHRRC